MSICLSVCLSLSIYQSVCVFLPYIYPLSVYSFLIYAWCMSICLSISIYLSVCLSVCLSAIYLSFISLFFFNLCMVYEYMSVCLCPSAIYLSFVGLFFFIIIIIMVFIALINSISCVRVTILQCNIMHGCMSMSVCLTLFSHCRTGSTLSFSGTPQTTEEFST